MSEERKVTAINFNTVLMFVLLGLIGWLGYTTFDNSKTLSAQAAVNSESWKHVNENLTEIKRKLDDAVTRREFDAKTIQTETRLSELTIRLREIDIAILELKSTLKARP
jgi:predicted negative regulator of RcsB-dependent stress response